MAGVTDICNMALMRVGHSTTISDINENSSAARLCNTFYPVCRDTVLRTMQPKFANKRATLALLAQKPSNWGFAYAYPSDCIAMQGVVPNGVSFSSLLPQNRPAWSVANVNGVKAIVTNLDQAECEYTCRFEDVTQWDAVSVSALAYLLGYEVGNGLGSKATEAQRCMQGYQMTLSQAAAIGLNEQAQGEPPTDEFTAARGSSSPGNQDIWGR